VHSVAVAVVQFAVREIYFFWRPDGARHFPDPAGGYFVRGIGWWELSGLLSSKFNPIDVLKGSLAKGSSNATLRLVLVVVQFTISMIMIICTWVVYNQLKYLQNKDVGFNKHEVLSLTVNTNSDVSGKILAFKNEMRKNPKILSVSTSQAIPGNGVAFNLFEIETKKGYVDKGVFIYGADEDYFKTLG